MCLCTYINTTAAELQTICATKHKRSSILLQGQKASSIMQAGEFVPTAMICDLLVRAMTSSGASRFLVDGFPRQLGQLKEFEQRVRGRHPVRHWHAVSAHATTCSEDSARRRDLFFKYNVNIFPFCLARRCALPTSCLSSR
jgi:hypothetical protein